MDDHLKLFLESIKEVDSRYIRYKEDVLKIEKQNNDEKYKEHVERVFAYELYHRWSNKLDNLPEEKRQGLMINAELTKYLKTCFDGLKNVDGMSDDHQGKGVIYPDLVLHKGQEDKTIHEIVCEIKRSSNHDREAYAEDLKKLIKMTYPRENTENFVPYNYGVFLLFGDKDKDWYSMKNAVEKISKQMRDMVIDNKVYIVNAFIVGEGENAHVDFNKIDLYDLL